MSIPLRYGNVLTNIDNILIVPFYFITAPKNYASIIQSSNLSTNPTTFGNGFRFGDSGAQVLTAPMTSLSATYLPISSPKGSLALDSYSNYIVTNEGTNDLWVKSDTAQTSWAPSRKTYATINFPTAATTIANNTLTFIDCNTNGATSRDQIKTNFGSSFGEQNKGVGNQTVYTNGYYVVVPFDGVYLIQMSLGLNAGVITGYQFYVSIYVDGVEAHRGWNAGQNLGSSAAVKVSHVVTVKYLTKNQKVSFAAFQASGGTRTVAAVANNNNAITSLGG